MFLWLILIGAAAFLVLGYFVMSGPSPAKTLKRRVEALKERHGEGGAAAAQAQIRKAMAERASKIESYASNLIPKNGGNPQVHAVAVAQPEAILQLAVANQHRVVFALRN